MIWQINVSPDEKSLYYTQLQSSLDDVMLISAERAIPERSTPLASGPILLAESNGCYRILFNVQ